MATILILAAGVVARLREPSPAWPPCPLPGSKGFRTAAPSLAVSRRHCPLQGPVSTFCQASAKSILPQGQKRQGPASPSLPGRENRGRSSVLGTIQSGVKQKTKTRFQKNNKHPSPFLSHFLGAAGIQTLECFWKDGEKETLALSAEPESDEFLLLALSVLQPLVALGAPKCP